MTEGVDERARRGREQVQWARACVLAAAGGAPASRPEAPWCEDCSATFVTVRWRDGTLQGCIGTLRTTRTLVDDIAYNAAAAATRDPRSRPLAASDVDDLEIELSILSPLEEVTTFGPGHETTLRSTIRPGIDGLVIEHEGDRATLLPSMWTQLPDLETFLDALARKVRVPRSKWTAETRLLRYTTERFTDEARGD